jgi:N-acetylglucosaminyl-diphospho-decaprenol L-rhamnosyltransferase
VVNHDAGEALLACVASLRRSGIEQIVVVDNASADGSLEELAHRDRSVVIVPTGRNLGYGSAMNIGVARTSREFVMICNPDLTVDPDTVAVLAAHLVEVADCAVVGPRIDNPDGTRYPSARAFPSLDVAAGHALLGQFWPENRWSKRYRMDARFSDGDEAGGEVDWVSGACSLVRADAFSSVGGFDARYFMYAEDVDLCWRLRRAGWRVEYDGRTRVVHAQGLSTSRHPLRMLAAHHVSTLRFARRSTDGPARALLPLMALALAARFAVAVGREVTRAGRRAA